MSRSQPPIDTSSHLIEPPRIRGIEEPPVVWSELFGADRDVELEIGSGKGLFLLNSATANPNVNYLGIELAAQVRPLERHALVPPRYRQCQDLVRRRPVGTRTPRTGASLRAVHVYFPDPWWKKRHKKRRVFSDALVTEIERVLRPGGMLRVASDVEEYFSVIQDLVATHPRFQKLASPEIKEPQHSADYLTNFERKYRIEGRPIHRTDYLLINAAKS